MHAPSRYPTSGSEHASTLLDCYDCIHVCVSACVRTCVYACMCVFIRNVIFDIALHLQAQKRIYGMNAEQKYTKLWIAYVQLKVWGFFLPRRILHKHVYANLKGINSIQNAKSEDDSRLSFSKSVFTLVKMLSDLEARGEIIWKSSFERDFH